MCKKNILLFIAFIALNTTLFSQNQSKSIYTVKGTVVDSISGETIPFCTVSASKVKSPINYLKRVAGDVSGNFILELNAKDTLLIKFESVGMKSLVKTVTITDPTTNLGKVTLSSESKTISEVTVTAAKPLVKVDLDKITYDMKSDPESQTSNTLDMLRKVPMVTVDADENIKVKGKSNFKIFMNGKATNMISNNPSQVLKSIPASTIKSIEVITEPGAKYEAEGLAGIINIVTESAMKGYTGTIRAGVDNYGGINGGLYLSTKIGKWGITANLNQTMFRSPENTNTFDRESLIPSEYKYLNQTSSGQNGGNYRYGNLSVSYELDSLNLITLSGNGWSGSNTSTSNGLSSVRSETLGTIQSYSSKNESGGSWGGYDGSLDYQRSFKKPDKLLTASYKVSYSPMTNESSSDITSIKNYFDRNQKITSNSSGTEHTLQLDYTEPFNKKHVVEGGVKYILRLNNSENDYKLYNSLTGSWDMIPVDVVNLGMNQTQDILGVYGSYTFKLKKFSVRAGGRLERTSSKIEYKDGSSFSPNSFANVVPSVTFNYKLNDASSIQTSYTQRISRPNIWYLNPFKNTSDPKNISQGNPDLSPEISNSFNVNYNFFNPKFNCNVSVYSSFTNNSIEEISELVDTVTYTTYENIGKSRNSGASFYFRWQVNKNINFYFNGDGGYTYLSYTSNGDIIKNDGYSYSGYFGGSYSLPKEFRINLYSGYSSPSVSLQSKFFGYHYYGLSLNKSMLKKKLNISMSAGGFLEKYMRYKSQVTTETYKSENIYQRKSPRFSIQVSYTFGQMKEQIKTTQRTIKNDDVKSGGGNNSSGNM
ncbi:MAG: TonB-dependent receptor [Paludibacteraceae bacterium]